MQLKLFNATPNDFKEVCELKPRILHLSMHGGLESNKLKILREKCRASFGKNFITTKQLASRIKEAYEKEQPENFRLFFETNDAKVRYMGPEDFS